MRSFDGKLRMCESLKASFCSSSECPQVQSLQISILIHRFAESDFSQDIFIGICRSNILQDIKPPSNGGTMCAHEVRPYTFVLHFLIVPTLPLPCCSSSRAAFKASSSLAFAPVPSNGVVLGQSRTYY